MPSRTKKTLISAVYYKIIKPQAGEDEIGKRPSPETEMPKKMGTNTKAEAAKERRSAAEADRKDRETREKVDLYWRDAGEGSKTRAAKKREEDAGKRVESAARKAEARRLAEDEEKELDKAGKKPDKKATRVSIPVPKVTEAELRLRKEEEAAEMARRAEEAKRRHARMADEEEYERVVMVSNTNRDDSVVEAHSVDEAVAKMSLADAALPVDKHPEKRLKASYKVNHIQTPPSFWLREFSFRRLI